MTSTPTSDNPEFYLELDDTWCTHNYHPLPVVIAEASGAWVTDVAGHRYLDMLAGYSALNFGHGHPALIAAAKQQLDRVTLTSRAFHHDQLGLFCKELAELTGTEMVLPMNSGAEAVEAALKVARKWAYRIKGVPENQAQIITAGGNFHGRTISIISFSDDPVATADYGPYTPGFIGVKYGDLEALSAAITENTAAILLEPIQGEAGVLVPPPGYLAEVRRLCDANNVLFIADEIQSGLGRTGELLALDHEGVKADLYTLGKALGGGIMPVSAVVGRKSVLGVLQPGQHGSTFGGNPARLCHRAGGRQAARDRRDAGQGSRTRRPPALPAERPDRARRRRGSRSGALGRGAACSGSRCRAGDQRGDGPPRHPDQGDPRDDAALRPAHRDHHRGTRPRGRHAHRRDQRDAFGVSVSRPVSCLRA